MSEILIREAGRCDFPAVQQCMARVFHETAGRKAGEFDHELWEWQYQNNELGSAVILAEDGDTVCGYYHAVILPMSYHGESVVGAMVQDVGTAASHRRRGIFRKMGAAALETLRQRDVSFIYTFPNARSLPSFVRNHSYTVLAKVPVYLAPLRAGDLLASRLPVASLARAFGNATQSLYRTCFQRYESLLDGESVSELTETDESLDGLDPIRLGPRQIALKRSHSYLRWRFFSKPGGNYRLFALSRGGAVRAYLATRPSELFSSKCLLLMDFGCSEGEEQALCRLVASRLIDESEDGAALAVTMGLHPMMHHFSRLGFRRVPERFNPRPFNLLSKEVNVESNQSLYDPSQWLITLADWDVF